MSYSATSRVLWSRISDSPAVAAWNSGIKEAVDRGCFDGGLRLYNQMRRAGLRPDWLTFPFVVKACAKVADDICARAVHGHVVKSPFCSDVFVQTALMDMYLKHGRLDSAAAVFEAMPERDVAAWNVMLMGFSQLGSLSRTLGFFRVMRLEGLAPDSITFVPLAQACAAEESLTGARCAHGLAIRAGAAGDVSVANTLISSYSKCGDLGAAESAFSEISTGDRTVVSWNSMIAGYARHGRPADAAACFGEMRRWHGGPPEACAAVSLLSAWALSTALSEGEKVHSLAIRGGLDSDSTVGNALISLYSKCDDVGAARRCFDGMPERTPVSWSTMIDGYASRGAVPRALELFHAMEASGEKPDGFAVAAILSACGCSGALDLGRSMNGYAFVNGLDSGVVVRNALMDMYMKCGCTAEARSLFDEMPHRTVVSWTTMISGYALNGSFCEALDLFHRMAGSGEPPNCVTFLAVLQACAHGGLLREGCEYFAMMAEVFKLAPRLEHYACVVDLLGRRGRLKDALSFVRSMPLEPDAGVWGALLGACSAHREVELGEHAARRLREMKPRAAASYVPLANAYASRGRWDDVAAVRAAMRWQGARKASGESSLHSGGRLHSFAAQDSCHPEAAFVCDVLRGLDGVMREDPQCMDFAADVSNY
ncbi:unnamed protein product [Spirodela intermedia]|uniref:Uncharacterized protein n=1 Tax=Spirodela intermedia TaxID=51605 RepID=A0A7I8KT93_SPIIN|nr:unnamed protein product [Spirodela intermedia]